MAAPLCGFLVCPTRRSHSGKRPVKHEQCAQFVVPCFACFCVLCIVIYFVPSVREKKNLYCRLCVTPCFDVRSLLMRELNATYYWRTWIMKGKEGYVMCLLLGHVLNMFTAKQCQFCLLVLDGCWCNMLLWLVVVYVWANTWSVLWLWRLLLLLVLMLMLRSLNGDRHGGYMIKGLCEVNCETFKVLWVVVKNHFMKVCRHLKNMPKTTMYSFSEGALLKRTHRLDRSELDNSTLCWKQN